MPTVEVHVSFIWHELHPGRRQCYSVSSILACQVFIVSSLAQARRTEVVYAVHQKWDSPYPLSRHLSENLGSQWVRLPWSLHSVSGELKSEAIYLKDLWVFIVFLSFLSAAYASFLKWNFLKKIYIWNGLLGMEFLLRGRDSLRHAGARRRTDCFSLRWTRTLNLVCLCWWGNAYVRIVTCMHVDDAERKNNGKSLEFLSYCTYLFGYLRIRQIF
jgi:hypothetical protein